MTREEYIKKEDAIKAFEKSLLGKYILWDMQERIKKDMQERISQLPIYSFPEELSEDGTLTVHVSDGSKVTRVFVMGDNIFGGLYYPDSDENKGEWIGDKDYPICSKCGTNFMDYVHYTEDAVCLKNPIFALTVEQT